MKLTYFGHSCFQIEVNGKNLLFDPFITPNELAKEVDVNAIIPDYILCSHAHQDHTADVALFAAKKQATVIGIWELAAYYQKMGLKTHPMNIGGTWQFDFGNLKMVQAAHSSSFVDGAYAGNPAGFFLNNNQVCLYYSGDTALMAEMSLWKELYKPNFAILPIGDNFTMNAEEAAIAAQMLGVKKVLGVHYDTFGYITINKESAMVHFTNKGIDLILLAPGNTIEI